MMQLSLLVHRHRRDVRRRSESGFTLIAVLFVVLITSALVVALVGLTFATTVAANQQEIRDRQATAADAALEASVNQIALDATGNLGFPYRLNASGNSFKSRDCTVPQAMTSGNPQTTIYVSCVSQDPPTGSLAGVDNKGWVRVVGTSYAGDLKDTAMRPSDWSTTLGPVESGATTAALTAAKPTMVHVGPNPLSIAADVDVKRSVAGRRDPVLANPNTFDSAIAVTGQFHQGEAGLFDGAAMDASNPSSPNYQPGDGSNTCGILDTQSHDWTIYGAAVRSGEGLSCNDSNSAGLDVNKPGLVPEAPTVWTSRAVQSAARTVPGSCPGGADVSLPAGSYNKVETAKLNSLLSGSCANHRFLFGPGNYWFDVDDGANNPTSNALVIDDPTAVVIFGTPKSGAASDTCDPSAAGAAVTLSPRTSIRHQRGRVSICGTSGAGSVALWQGPNANLGGQSPPTTASSPGVSDFSNPGAVLTRDGNVATAVNNVIFCLQDCSGWKELTVSGIGSTDGTPLAAPVNSVQVLVNASQHDANNSAAQVELTLTTKDANPISCTVRYQRLPENNETVAYELMDPTRGDCAARVRDRAQLYNADVTLRFYLSQSCGLFGIICWSGGPRLDIDSVSVRIPWTPVASSANPSASYSNPAGALRVGDGASATRSFDCPIFTINCTKEAYSELTLDNLQDYAEPDLTATAPGARLTSVGAVVSGDSDHADGSKATTQFTVYSSKIPNGSCFASFQGLADDYKTVYYDLLSAPIGNCSTRLTAASQLVGASLRLTNYLDRNGCIGWPFCSSWGASVDYVGISTTSEMPKAGGGYTSTTTYDGPTSPFLVTSNSDSTSPGFARFSAIGQVALPRADLDVHWAGPYDLRSSDSPAPGSMGVQPLFGGSGLYALTVNGLGSSATAPNAQVGVLCCSPAKASERRVTLQARLGSANGPLRGEAQVLISDVSFSPANPGQWRPGQRVSVEKWNLCNGIAPAQASLPLADQSCPGL